MTNHKPIIRTATPHDVEQFLGSIPSCSMRAIVVEKEGAVIGIVGMAYHGDVMVAFSKIDDDMRKYPILIMKAAKRFAGMLRKYGGNVVAVACNEESNSQEFLKRVGFVHSGTSEDGEIYRWHNF